MHEVVAAAPGTIRAAYPANTAEAVEALTTSATRWPGPALLWVDVRGADTRLLDDVPRALRGM
jgi:hypothetical protein